MKNPKKILVPLFIACGLIISGCAGYFYGKKKGVVSVYEGAPVRDIEALSSTIQSGISGGVVISNDSQKSTEGVSFFVKSSSSEEVNLEGFPCWDPKDCPVFKILSTTSANIVKINQDPLSVEEEASFEDIKRGDFVSVSFKDNSREIEKIVIVKR